MFTKQNFILLFTLILVINNTESVSFPAKCKQDDSDCLTRTAQEYLPTFVTGIPEIGVIPTDPFIEEYIDASSAGLKFIVRDIHMTGLKNATINKIRFDKGETLTIKYTCTLNLDGTYELIGNMLFLQIEGNGPLHCVLRKLEVIIKADIKEKIGSDGKKYITLIYKSYSYKPKDECDVVFENLFNGNPVLAAAAKEMIATNANLIIMEVGPPFVRPVIDVLLQRINQIFNSIPKEDLFIIE